MSVVTLLVAYTGWHDRTPGRRAGSTFKRLADANAVSIGPAHAVEEGSDVALCSVQVGPQPRRQEWPPGMGSRCPDCRTLAAPAS